MTTEELGEYLQATLSIWYKTHKLGLLPQSLGCQTTFLLHYELYKIRTGFKWFPPSSKEEEMYSELVKAFGLSSLL